MKLLRVGGSVFLFLLYMASISFAATGEISAGGTCNDGIDGDLDGFIDCADSACFGNYYCSKHFGGSYSYGLGGGSKPTGNNVSSIIPAVCGNSIIERPEVCDDGNVNKDDFCSSDCKKITTVKNNEKTTADTKPTIKETIAMKKRKPIKMDMVALIRMRNIQDALSFQEQPVVPESGADPAMSYEEFLGKEYGDIITVHPRKIIKKKRISVYPKILAETGAKERNMMYLLLSLFGIIGLIFTLFGKKGE